MIRARAVALEVGLLAALLLVVVGGSFAAQRRQVPPAVVLDALGVLLLVGAVAVVAVRHRWPRMTFAVTAVICGTYLLLGYPYGPILLAASVAVFTLANAETATVGGVAVLAAIALWLAAVAQRVVPTEGWGALAAAGTGFAAWLIIPTWWGVARGRHRDAAAAADEARRHELDQQRLELAREVHDVVAHNLTVIGVQTGAALRVLDRDLDRAREALTTIAKTNRNALTELRDTLDVLRAPDRVGTVERRVPAGSLGELPALIDSARAGGSAVDLHACDLPAGHVSPSVEGVAYRIVQEALTNAVRHAPCASVTVNVAHHDDVLQVRIADDGPGLRGRPEGRGIAGMRERAAALGGTLDLGAGPDGTGAVVSAHLPLKPERR